MNAKSLLWGLTLFVLSLQQMHAKFTVGTLDRDKGVLITNGFTCEKGGTLEITVY
jgi:hypothetical protein